MKLKLLLAFPATPMPRLERPRDCTLTKLGEGSASKLNIFDVDKVMIGKHD